MQRKYEDSDKENQEDNYYCAESDRAPKRYKTEEEESFKQAESEEECLDYLTEKEEKGYRVARERRQQVDINEHMEQIKGDMQHKPMLAMINRIQRVEE